MNKPKPATQPGTTLIISGYVVDQGDTEFPWPVGLLIHRTRTKARKAAAQYGGTVRRIKGPLTTSRA